MLLLVINTAEWSLPLSTLKEAFYEAPTPLKEAIPPELPGGQPDPPEEPRRPHARRYPPLMACYHPKTAYWKEGGGLTFDGRKGGVSLQLPCGQCIGCRLQRSQDWATRITHEASLHEDNCFLTLTFRPEDLPWDRSVSVRDVQTFMRRLRKKIGSVRFFAVGEYGTNLSRPHYHIMLFGHAFPDRTIWSKSPSGHYLYRSAALEALWTEGFSFIGNVTVESAGYVARYCTKKINGDKAKEHYQVLNPETGEIALRTPEFAVMSRKPGLGGEWFKQFHADAFPSDFIVIDGQKRPIPRYYKKLLERSDPWLAQDVALAREERSRLPQARANSTPARLATREESALLRAERLKRQLENE